jgi:hypothetical protein
LRITFGNRYVLGTKQDEGGKDNCPSQSQDREDQERPEAKGNCPETSDVSEGNCPPLKTPALVLARRYQDAVKIFTPLPSKAFTPAMKDRFFEIDNEESYNAMRRNILKEIVNSTMVSVDLEWHIHDRDKNNTPPRMVILGTSNSCEVYVFKTEWANNDGILPDPIRKALVGSDCLFVGVNTQEDL